MKQLPFIAAISILASVLSPVAGLQAAELKVLAGGSMTAVLNELAPPFERASGHKLVMAELDRRASMTSCWAEYASSISCGVVVRVFILCGILSRGFRKMWLVELAMAVPVLAFCRAAFQGGNPESGSPIAGGLRSTHPVRHTSSPSVNRGHAQHSCGADF